MHNFRLSFSVKMWCTGKEELAILQSLDGTEVYNEFEL